MEDRDNRSSGSTTKKLLSGVRVATTIQYRIRMNLCLLVLKIPDLTYSNGKEVSSLKVDPSPTRTKCSRLIPWPRVGLNFRTKFTRQWAIRHSFTD